jgi:hypothetical protein
MTGTDLRIDIRIVLRAARTALPVVAEDRQHIMAAAILSSERLAAKLDGHPGAPISPQSSAAFAQAPGAARWAYGYTRHLVISHRAFRHQAAPTVVRYAVQGIAHACIADPDTVLRGLLVGAIEDCRTPRADVTAGRATNRWSDVPRQLRRV